MKKDNILIINIFIAIFTIIAILPNIIIKSIIITDVDISVWGIITVCVYVWAFVSYIKVNKSVISVYLLFLLYMFFSCCGQTFLNLIGFTKHWFVDVYANFTNEELLRYLQFQILCVILMNIGAILSNTKVRNKNFYKKRNRSNYNSKSVVIIYYILMLIVIGMLASRMSYRMINNYAAAATGGFADNLSVIWIFFVIVTALICFGNYKIHTKNAIVMSLAISMVCFMLGTRTYAIALLGILLFTYGKMLREKKKIPRLGKIKGLILLVLAFFALGSINLFTQLRSLPLSTLASSSIFEYFNPINSIVDTISEMGASASTVLRTMRCINQVGHQQTILYDTVEAVIPHFILNVFVKEPALNVEGLAHWVTYDTGFLLAGPSSMGYCCLAEAFLNFDMFGCLFMFIHGYLIVWLEKKSEILVDSGYILFPALAVTYISKQIFFARAQLDIMVDPVRYMIIIALICWAYNNVRKHERSYSHE